MFDVSQKINENHIPKRHQDQRDVLGVSRSKRDNGHPKPANINVKWSTFLKKKIKGNHTPKRHQDQRDLLGVSRAKRENGHPKPANINVKWSPFLKK